MSQHDYDIANQQGAPFRADVNAVLAAIQSNNSGGTAPTNTVAYMPWADTASGVLKIRNAANNGWVDVALLSNFALPSVQKQLATAFTTTGTSTAYLLTPAPAIAANAAGLRFRVKFHTPPGASPTMAVSGQTALPLKYKDASGTKQDITSIQVPSNWIADVETDGTDWVVLTIAAQTPAGQTDITAAYTVVAGDKDKVIRATSGTWTLSLSAASALGSDFRFSLLNVGSGTITIDPYIAETIDGIATTTVPPNSMIEVYCDGTGFVTNGFSLTQLKAIDGSGSGLDADMLDGAHASSFASSSAFTNCSYTTNYSGQGPALIFTRSNGGTLVVFLS